MKRFLLLLPVLAVLAISCGYVNGKRVRGNGNVISESRSFTRFTGADVSNAIHLYVKQDSVHSVRVQTDENLQQYILIEEENNILKISQQRNTNLNATGKIRVYITAPVIDYLQASGASKIIGENTLTATESITIDVSGASSADLEVKAPKISAEMSGASRINLAGMTKDLFIQGGGASDANCFDLLAENADVDLSGASNAGVFASVLLKAEASGASDIRYRGNAKVQEQLSGAGKVKKSE